MESKRNGNDCFAKGDYSNAAKLYLQAINELTASNSNEGSDSATASSSSSINEDLQILHSNIAASYLKLKQYQNALDASNKALDIITKKSDAQDKVRTKALFRRAQAKLGMNDMQGAYRDVSDLIKANPNIPEVKEFLQQLVLKMKGLNDPTAQLSPARKIIAHALENESSQKDAIRQLISMLQETASIPSFSRDLAKSSDGLWKLCEKDPLALAVISQVAITQYDQLSKANPDFVTTLRKYAFPSTHQNFQYEERTQTSAIITLLRMVDCGRSSRPVSEFEDEEPSSSSTASGSGKGASQSNKRKGRRREEKDIARLNEELWGEPNADAIKVFVDALNHPLSLPREAAVEACATYCGATEKHARLFVQYDGIEHLSTLAVYRPQLASVLLAKILPALKNQDEVQKHVVNMCSPLTSQNPYADKAAIDQTYAAACSLLALLQANQELGVWVVEQDEQKILKSLGSTHIAEAPDKVVAVVAEIFCQIANSEKGRGILGDITQGPLQTLIHSTNESIRSAASVALAKMNAVKFDSSSEQGSIVLGAVATLLGKNAKEEEIKRGVEALDYVIQDVDVKTLLTAEGDGIKILHKLCELAMKEESAKSAFAYGLAYLFANITMDSDEARKEKLREMEVTEEQYEQFEELTKSKTRVGRKDTPEEVAARVDAFVRSDGIKALRALVFNSGGGERVCITAGKALLNCAGQQRVRGTMIAQGSIGALLKIVSSFGTGAYTKTKDATHALARLLITTDPRLLSESQVMDSIAPLLEQIRNCDDQLVLFECLMALTNIGSISWEAKERIVSLKGISPIEYAQFNDNLMVRRAATEALANIAQVDEVIEWISNPEKCRLWLLLSEDWDQDMETARAASGVFANISSVPKITKVLRSDAVKTKDTEENGIERIIKTATGCLHDEIRHRMSVALAEIASSDDPEVRSDEKELSEIIDALDMVSKMEVPSASSDFALQALETLRNLEPLPPNATVEASVDESTSE